MSIEVKYLIQRLMNYDPDSIAELYIEESSLLLKVDGEVIFEEDEGI